VKHTKSWLPGARQRNKQLQRHARRNGQIVDGLGAYLEFKVLRGMLGTDPPIQMDNGFRLLCVGTQTIILESMQWRRKLQSNGKALVHRTVRCPLLSAWSLLLLVPPLCPIHPSTDIILTSLSTD
jgi:hypothetical protein